MWTRRRSAWLAFLVALVLATPVPAAALGLDAAKSQGLVGEKADGYLGIVGANPSAEVKALANSVNTQRRAKYEEIARKNGTAVDAVAALAGQKLVDRAPAGQWVTDAAGNWRRK
jgi:uncharacterized protein YdbL (DUF1318 family)